MKYLILILSVIFLTGCSLKDPNTCEMKNSRIIFNLNLDSDTPESSELLSKIQNINNDFTISNRNTNIINTNYFEAVLFYQNYQEIIKNESNKIKNGNSEFRRELNNKVIIHQNDCPIKTLYINGISTEVRSNVEYIITLSD